MTKRIYVGVGLLAGALLTATAGAQGAASDSLAARLRRAEAAIEVLQKQLAEQSESGVQSRTRASVEISGRVLMNAFGNSNRVNNVDNPQFVKPDTIPGFPGRGVGMAIRHTRLALAVRGPEAFGAAFSGDVDVDFHGGQLPSGGGRTFPLVRLRTARGFLRWKYVEAMAGQESPLVSGVNPIAPTAVGTPQFAAAGNLWLWLPQVRLSVASTGRVQVGAQGAILAPTSGDPATNFETDNDMAERSQRPYLQGRVFAKWGEAEMAGEFGCGAHVGWLIPTFTAITKPIIRSDAVACDAVIPVLGWLEVRGEFFTGQSLRGLGGGGIGQNFKADTSILGTSGGWAQLNLRPTFGWRVGLGCGGDHPDPGALRRRNDACAAYTIVRPSGPLFFGAEYRKLRTEYAAGRRCNDHVTLALGFEF